MFGFQLFYTLIDLGLGNLRPNLALAWGYKGYKYVHVLIKRLVKRPLHVHVPFHVLNPWFTSAFTLPSLTSPHQSRLHCCSWNHASKSFQNIKRAEPFGRRKKSDQKCRWPMCTFLQCTHLNSTEIAKMCRYCLNNSWNNSIFNLNFRSVSLFQWPLQWLRCWPQPYQQPT